MPDRFTPTTRRNHPAWLAPVGLLCLALCATQTLACDVPVFRYALERWRSDVYRATIFHRGELAGDDAAAVAALRSRTVREQRTANLDVHLCDVSQPLEPELAELWSQQPQDSALPQLVLQSPFIKGRRLIVWSGPISEFDPEQALNSSALNKLVERLFAGDSVVWLVFTPEGNETDEKVDLLSRELERLGDELPLPEGIGLPGSEVYSDVPLTLRFSTVRVRMGAPAEQFLETTLRRFAPPSAADQPIVVPVYGRGRALEVIPLARVDEALIEDVSRFLSGACSCQVKDLNPGFDLLLAVDWEKQLFPDSEPPPDNPPGQQKRAKLVPVTTTSSPPVELQPAVAMTPAAAHPSASRDTRWTGQGLAIAAVAVGVCVIGLSLKPPRAPRDREGGL